MELFDVSPEHEIELRNAIADRRKQIEIRVYFDPFIGREDLTEERALRELEQLVIDAGDIGAATGLDFTTELVPGGMTFEDVMEETTAMMHTGSARYWAVMTARLRVVLRRAQ